MTAYGPYTPVRSAGDLLFVSGQIGIDSATKIVPDGVAEQTNLAIQNMEQALAAAGASLQDVVKTTVFLTNMDDFSTMNEVYEKLFEAPRPARSTIAVHELPRLGGKIALRVEIEAVAYKESA